MNSKDWQNWRCPECGKPAGVLIDGHEEAVVFGDGMQPIAHATCWERVCRATQWGIAPKIVKRLRDMKGGAE